MADLTNCMTANKDQERAMGITQEKDKSDQKIRQCENMKLKESKTMRQNFSIMDQGPSHGESWSRPHTMVYRKGIKDKNPNASMNMTGHHSMLSSGNEMPYNRRRTENTVFAQDYLKAWNKVQTLKPVLKTQNVKISMSSYQEKQYASNNTMLNIPVGISKVDKPDFMNHSHNCLGSRTMTASRALDSTHETIKTRMTDTRRTASSNNLSASFSASEIYGNKSVGSHTHFMKATKSSRSKFTVR